MYGASSRYLFLESGLTLLFHSLFSVSAMRRFVSAAHAAVPCVQLDNTKLPDDGYHCSHAADDVLGPRHEHAG